MKLNESTKENDLNNPSNVGVVNNKTSINKINQKNNDNDLSYSPNKIKSQSFHTTFIKLNQNQDEKNKFKVKLDYENQFKNAEQRIKINKINIQSLSNHTNKNLND